MNVHMRTVKLGIRVVTAMASDLVHDLAGSRDSMPDRLACDPWLLGAAFLAGEEELVVERHRVGFLVERADVLEQSRVLVL